MTTVPATAREIVLDFRVARSVGDHERVAALLADDVEMVFPRSYRPPLKGDEVVAYFCGGGAASNLFVPGTLKVEAKRVTAEDDVVIVEQTASGRTHSGDEYVNNYVLVYELRDGRIARIIEHVDTLHAARIMGTFSLVLPGS